MVNSAKWDIYIIKGQSYQKSLYFTSPDGTILDLTGYSFVLEVKKDKNEPKAIFTLTEGDGITVYDSEGAVVIDITVDDLNRLYGLKCCYTFKMTSAGNEVSFPFVGDIYLNSNSSKTELTGSSAVNIKVEEQVYQIGIADGDIANAYSRGYIDTEMGLKQDKTDNTYVDTAIANLVNTAPGTLDTLNELAGALGDDPNFATTISAQIGTKANSSHTHTKSDITDLDAYQKSEVDLLLNAKADADVSYTITQIDGALLLKADQATTYTKTEITAIKGLLDVDILNRAVATTVYTKQESDTIIDGVNTSINTKATQATTYTKTEVDASIGVKADQIATYTKTQVDTVVSAKEDQGVAYTKAQTDTSLGLKANQSTTYTKTEVDSSLTGKETADANILKQQANGTFIHANKATFTQNAVVEITEDSARGKVNVFNNASRTSNFYMFNANGYGALGMDSNHAIKFITNNIERMEISSSGNVGISKTNATEKLDVAGNVKATAFIGDGSQLTGVSGGGGGSSASSYGGMHREYVNDSIVVSSMNDYLKIENFWQQGQLTDFTFNANGSLTYTGSSSQLFKITIVFDINNAQSGNYEYFAGKIFKNGSEVAGTKASILSSSYAASISLQALIVLATNDKIELYAANASGTDNFNVDCATVLIHSI